MTKQTLYRLLEHDLTSTKQLSARKRKALLSMQEELIRFIERNSFSAADTRQKAIHYLYCPQCLKAHIIEHAAKKGYDEEIVRDIAESFKCKQGHNGFYLDNDELHPVTTQFKKNQVEL